MSDDRPADVVISAEQLVEEYLRIQSRIAELELRARYVKDGLTSVVPPFSPDKTQSWVYGPGVVSWVKGRRTEKVDHKALRRELVLAGVTPEILDGAYSKATVVSEASPHLRISGVSTPPEEA